MVAGVIFFSTVVEPSAVNSQSTIELWASLCGEVWKRVKIFDKDKLSLKYFQYGQIILPNQQLNDQFFCFSEFSTKKHLKIHRLDVAELIKTNSL